MKNLKNDFLLHTSFVTKGITSSFYSYEKALMEYMNDWEKSNEIIPRKEEFFKSLEYGRMLLMQIRCNQKNLQTLRN